MAATMTKTPVTAGVFTPKSDKIHVRFYDDWVDLLQQTADHGLV
jgi:hypothetical protein